MMIILLTTVILFSGGFLTLKIFIWNGYNEATYFEKEIRSQLKKVQNDPENLTARSKLFEGFYQKGQYEEAKIQAEYVIDHAEPSSELMIKALYYRSLINGIAGNYDEALVDLKKVVALNDQHGEAWLSLGRLYVSMGEIELAEDAIAIADNLLDESAEPLYLKGHIHYANGEMDVAKEVLEQAINLEPTHKEAQQLLEQVSMESKKQIGL